MRRCGRFARFRVRGSVEPPTCRFSSSKAGPWGPPSLVYNGYRSSLPVVKLPGRGVDHPVRFSAEVKNEWFCTSITALCLHDVLRGDLYPYLSKVTENLKVAGIRAKDVSTAPLNTTCDRYGC